MDAEFCFEHQCNGSLSEKIHFAHTFRIPLDNLTSPADQCAMIIATKNIQCYAQTELRKQLTQFFRLKTEEYLEQEAGRFVDNFCSLPDEECEAFAKRISSRFTSELKGYGPSETVEGEDLFSEVYQSLLHSSDAADVSALLAKEEALARDLRTLIRERNWELDRMRKEHADIVEQASHEHEKDNSTTDKASKHFERIHFVERNYASQISALMESQRREYRSFVFKLHESQVVRRASEGNVDPGSIESGSTQSTPEKTLHPLQRSGRGQPESFSHGSAREESFTIYLGAQMKTMHNLRLCARDPVDLCGSASSPVDRSSRLQMALSLYGNQLSAIVLLVQSRPTYHINYQTEFYKSCEQSTELHFDSLDCQLEKVEREVLRANQYRREHSETSEMRGTAGGESLKTGDVYVTRHSNLTQVHLVFHMVSDDALKKDINSRHPCINGLRNVIRLCSKYGVTTIGLPLLLVDKMTEDLTVSWCLKRSELVFKCVKGFLMEGAALGGTSSGNLASGHHPFYNVQYFVPPEISVETFSQIREMVPSIYHFVNPVMGNG